MEEGGLLLRKGHQGDIIMDCHEMQIWDCRNRLLKRLLEGERKKLRAHGVALADSCRGEDCGSSFLPASHPEPRGVAVDPLNEREELGCANCNCPKDHGAGHGVECVLVVYAHQLEAGIRCQSRAQSVTCSFGASTDAHS
jgi:hypothetical protein